jgi:ATP dependent DNA ligase domain
MERISAVDSRRSRELWIAFLTKRTVIDGEIVAVNEDGAPSFNLLQNFGGSEHTILFYAFDLLILAGTDLRSRPLEQRRALLRELIPGLGDSVRQSETFDVPAAELLATIRQHGLNREKLGASGPLAAQDGELMAERYDLELQFLRGRETDR